MYDTTDIKLEDSEIDVIVEIKVKRKKDST